MSNPRAFISHATEDKKIFVLDFASKLRENGIDAWLDRWEMYPGDSLVDKIFEEGIKDADVFIVVLSRNSTYKPWVRDELNAGVVKRIEHGCKLIPVIIDDCEIPVSLNHTIWQRIKDTASYDAELQQIILSIFGQQLKPPLGKPPSYISSNIHNYPGLTKIDSLVFKYCCDFAISKQEMARMHEEDIFISIKSHDIQRDSFRESLSALAYHNYIEFHGPTMISIRDYGFTNHLNLYVSGYEEIYKNTAYKLANLERRKAGSEIDLFGNHNLLFVRHALNTLRSKGLVNFSYTNAGTPYIKSISPMLKRHLFDLE